MAYWSDSSVGENSITISLQGAGQCYYRVFCYTGGTTSGSEVGTGGWLYTSQLYTTTITLSNLSSGTSYLLSVYTATNASGSDVQRVNYIDGSSTTIITTAVSLTSGNLTLKLGDGISYITGAYVTGANVRHPASESDKFYPDDVSEAFTCNRFWVESVEPKEGYTFPWNATYSGYYTTYAGIKPTSGQSSSVNVTIYPNDNSWASFSISATPITSTVTFQHYLSDTGTTYTQTSMSGVAYGTNVIPEEHALAIAGYRYAETRDVYGNVVTNQSIKANTTFILYYEPITYTVTFNHYSTGGVLIASESTASGIGYGETITPSLYAKTITGYSYKEARDASGSVITAKAIYANTEITLYYTPIPDVTATFNVPADSITKESATVSVAGVSDAADYWCYYYICIYNQQDALVTSNGGWKYQTDDFDFTATGLEKNTTYEAVVYVATSSGGQNQKTVLTTGGDSSYVFTTSKGISIASWSWSSGASSAFLNKGKTSDVLSSEWNDLCAKITECTKAAEVAWSSDVATMVSDKAMTAARFNAVRSVLASNYSIVSGSYGTVPVAYKGNTVYGWYFMAFEELLNGWISELNNS